MLETDTLKTDILLFQVIFFEGKKQITFWKYFLFHKSRFMPKKISHHDRGNWPDGISPSGYY